MKHRFLFGSVAVLLMMVCSAALPAVEIAAATGDEITLDVGSDDGVRTGMTGRVMTRQSVGGTVKSFEIAQFEITAVEPSRSTATLTQVGAGWTVEPGMDLVFDQSLSAPAPGTGTIVIRSNVLGDVAFFEGRRLGPTPQTLEVSPGTYTVRVEKDNYEPVEERVILIAGKETVFRAILTRRDGGQAELLFWDSIKTSSDVNDFRAYLKRWPDGLFAELARNRIDGTGPRLSDEELGDGRTTHRRSKSSHTPAKPTPTPIWGFYIQPLATSEVSSITDARRRLMKIGFVESRLHVIETTVAGGNRLFKLRVGPFPHRIAAEEVLVRIRHNGFVDAWIVAP